MEHLPPPPPHLLQSDDELDQRKSPKDVIAQRGVSVADSIKALQKSGHLPCSPKSLRRAHSVTGAHSPYVQQTPQHQEQIYAPVAHLQQKIQQRQQQQQQQRSPEGEQYGFGMQFKQHQNQFFDVKTNIQPPPQNVAPAHDQIMRDVDPNMRNRPQPPPISNPQQSSSNYDAQTAMRVRRWIESKTVADVRDCRPFLNAEIHQGFSLRKNAVVNDRSAPKF